MNKSTWILGVVVVVLGLIYLITKEDKASVGIKRLKLPTFVMDKIDKIEILGKEKVRMSKSDGHWSLDIGDEKKPVLVDADPQNVESMLLAAEGIRNSHYVTNLGEKYDDLGLGSSAISLNLFENGKKVWSLLLGNSASASTRYAKLPDDPDVFAIRGAFWQLTRNGLKDWRDHHIFPVAKDAVSSLTIKRASGSLLIEKNSDGVFVLSNSQSLPAGYRVDSASLLGLVNSVVAMNASDFVDKEISLGEPIMKITLTADKDQYGIEIFSKDGEHLVKRLSDNRVFHISKSSFDAINKGLEDVRDLSLLDFDKNSTVGLKIRHGKEMIVLAKEENSWKIKEPKLPNGFEFDPNSVQGMISMLSGLDAARTLKSSDKAKDPNWQNEWLVLVELDKGEPIKLFASVNRANSDEMLVKGMGEPYIIKASRLKSITSGLDAFKKEKYNFPPIEEDGSGLSDLPEDVKRKILDAVKNQRKAS